MKTLYTVLFFFCFSIILISCGNDDSKPQNTGSSNNTKSSEKPQSTGNTNNQTNAVEELKQAPPESSSEKERKNTKTPNGIRVNFPVGSTEVTLNGKINGLEDQITYLFEVSKGQNLSASVRPQKGKGNIRINQIISPSGNADGPFSNQMTYALNESGDYQLVIGESLMEGEPFVGEYLLTVSIK